MSFGPGGVTIEAGFPFDVTLPTTIPSSFLVERDDRARRLARAGHGAPSR